MNVKCWEGSKKLRWVKKGMNMHIEVKRGFLTSQTSTCYTFGECENSQRE